MAIKLIAIDMDGTLLLPDHTISPAVKNAIAAAREKGVNVVLTTGRPYAGLPERTSHGTARRLLHHL